MTTNLAEGVLELAEKLSRALYSAGRCRADGMAVADLPMMSFKDWTQRELDACYGTAAPALAQTVLSQEAQLRAAHKALAEDAERFDHFASIYRPGSNLRDTYEAEAKRVRAVLSEIHRPAEQREEQS